MELVSLISIISTTISGIGPASHYNEKNQFLSTLNPALICEKPINKDIDDECLKLLWTFEDGTFEYSPASL